MAGPIRYGRQVVMAKDGDVTTITEELYNNFQTVKQVVVCSETVYIEDDKEILAHFLQMLDQQKRGEIDCIGIQLLRNQKTGLPRIEKTWIVPQP